MQTSGSNLLLRDAGYALVAVMTITGVSLVLLTGVLSWASNSAQITARNNVYFSNSGAAEAAAEKVIGAMAQDYPDKGEPWVYANLYNYRSTLPTSSDSSYWSGFQFSDGSGNIGSISVQRTVPWTFGSVPGKYKGLNANYATYRVTAGASTVSSSFKSSVSVAQQDLQLVSIPMFQYELFYGMDMEICPSADFPVTGRAHCNGNIYLQPDSHAVTFQSDVTAAGHILNTNAPGDPVLRQFGSVSYQGDHSDRARVLKLPMGMTNSPNSLLPMIQVPPFGEVATSLVGQQRYYNKADMVILVQDAGVITTSGSYNGFVTSIPWSTVNKFVNENVWFYDKRENNNIRSTQLDVNKLKGQLNNLKSMLGRDVKTIFIADFSTVNGNGIPAVRIINGATISSLGLTVATPHPLYVLGNFNTSGVNAGTTNTTQAFPASFVCDAFTVLSSWWGDGWSTYNLSYRPATSTTINAAVITGIVPTSYGNYSGGVENSIRLLEDWTGQTLTFNGSIAVLWSSQYASTPWGGTGQVYNQPTRKYGWDQNFATLSKLPPGEPEVRTVLRTQYSGQMVAGP